VQKPELVTLVLLAGATSCSSTKKPAPPVAVDAAPRSASTQEPTEEAFAGCSAKMDGRTTVTYACGTVVAQIDRMPTSGSPEFAVENAVQALTLASGMRTSVTKANRNLGGVPWSGATVRSYRGDAAEPETITTILSGDFGPWLLTVSCFAPPDRESQERCGRIINYLVLRGPPAKPAPPDQTAPPELAGRRLDVPRSCRVDNASTSSVRIACRDAELTWDVHSNHDAAVDFLGGVLKAQRDYVTGHLIEEQVACHVEDVPTICHRVAGDTPDGFFQAVYAVAELRKVVGIAQCAYRDPGKALPQECAVVFQVDVH
jgi:hypothetical protein